MSKYTTTPWRSQHDLLQIRAQFYTLNTTHPNYHSPDARRNAVDRVMAWKLRSNLPHAIESTALLTDALLHHDIPDNSSFSVRAVYSAAFTRFVTGFCDIGRNRERSLEPSSMLDIAKQIQMPVQFVALRHEATHEEMPSMQRLVSAVKEALQWLWNVYWSRLEEPVADDVGAGDLAQLRTTAKQVLRSYRTTRLEALRSIDKHGANEALLKAGEACAGLLESNTRRMQAFVDVLVDEKTLMPPKRELGARLDGAYLLWDPLLQFIAQRQKGFLLMLVQGLLSPLSEEVSPSQPREDAIRQGSFLWAFHILSYRVSSALGTSDRPALRRKAMEWCCTNPGFWATKLGESLLRIEDPEFKAQWQEMFECTQLDFEMITPDEVGDSDMDLDKEAPEMREYADAGSWIRAVAPVRGPFGTSR